jgi:riboflavin biosynthesis pyrimidine reductase
MEPVFYQDLQFPAAGSLRPYVFINMVATIDGKIVTGKRGEPVQDLGSETDHLMMRRIENAADGVLIGAGALRSAPNMWYPNRLYRFVATRSGKVPYDSRFFSDSPEKAYVVCPSAAEVPETTRTLRAGTDDVDWEDALQAMRETHGIERLLVEGGSDVNAQLFERNLIDEIFLTIAPKIKLGEDVPTIADGTALNREDVQDYGLIECNRWKDELFLRYRRR